MVELKEKYTVAVVTHNMQQASRVSDMTAFFLLGDVIEYGETRQIFNLSLRHIWYSVKLYRFQPHC